MTDIVAQPTRPGLLTLGFDLGFYLGSGMVFQPPGNSPYSFQIPKNISFIKINPKFHKHSNIFFPERLLLMMRFLILDVFINSFHVRSAVSETAITLLPFKPVWHQAVFIDPFRRFGLCTLHHTGYCSGRFNRKKAMHMILHPIYNQ
jgi:hypothetical protein